jgi:hypothetical protein
MSQVTHETAPTKFVEAGGIGFAYRRFCRPGDTPLLLLNYNNLSVSWNTETLRGVLIAPKVGTPATYARRNRAVGR